MLLPLGMTLAVPGAGVLPLPGITLGVADGLPLVPFAVLRPLPGPLVLAAGLVGSLLDPLFFAGIAVFSKRGYPTPPFDGATCAAHLPNRT